MMLCYDQSEEKGSLGVFIYNRQYCLKFTLIERTASIFCLVTDLKDYKDT